MAAAIWPRNGGHKPPLSAPAVVLDVEPCRCDLCRFEMVDVLPCERRPHPDHQRPISRLSLALARHGYAALSRISPIGAEAGVGDMGLGGRENGCGRLFALRCGTLAGEPIARWMDGHGGV